MYVYYSLAHRDFWKHTKHGWNFFLLKVGRTLIQSFAHLRQTWVLVEGHIGAVLKQLEANAVSNIATHHPNLLKVSLYSRSVSQRKKCIATKSCKFEDQMEKANRQSKKFSHDGHQIWKWSQEDREQATPLTDHELLHKLRFSHLQADMKYVPSSCTQICPPRNLM